MVGYTVQDVRTSGGTLWPKTTNEEFGRFARDRDSSDHHHTPPTQAGPLPPITRETVRSGPGPCKSTSISTTRTIESRPRDNIVFASSLASRINRHIPQKYKLAQSTGTQDW